MLSVLQRISQLFRVKPRADLAGRARLLVMSAGVSRITTLPGLLPEWTIVRGAEGSNIGDTVAAWGKRPSAARAQAYARSRGMPLLYLEDGLLRSFGPGTSGPPLSLMVDTLGLYLDASVATGLERCIQRRLTMGEQLRASELLALWREERVSKYNDQAEPAELPVGRYVLIIDQTAGDASVSAGLATSSSFELMLDSALSEYPDSLALVKVHPDVVSGRRKGYFDLKRLMSRPRVRVVADRIHPVALIEYAECVYTVTSQMGFEALIWGKPVRTFGMPFYAGWGLTLDTLVGPPRRAPVTLEQLVHGALIEYPRYVDPENGLPCTPEDVVRWIGLQRRMRARFGASAIALGFSKWKRPYISEFFQGTKLSFAKRLPNPSNLPIIVWGRKNDALLNKSCNGLPAKLVRVEDGFLRSVGLGADLVRPISWVQDPIGIYYDATTPSHLEHLLTNTIFSEQIRNRARLLRHRIVSHGLTKYNVGSGVEWTPPGNGKLILLVPGQVESDASIAFGGNRIRNNLDLLRTVRVRNPDAYIVYKPHPDVHAKLRDAGIGETNANLWCDEVVGEIAMGSLLDLINEVHTITSLTGFEALLRGIRVVTYGQPFYAGWGLTDDKDITDEVRARRGRTLDLDDLIAATLILYPTYVSRKTRMFTNVENALEELIAWRNETPRTPRLRRWFAYFTRKI